MSLFYFCPRAAARAPIALRGARNAIVRLSLFALVGLSASCDDESSNTTDKSASYLIASRVFSSDGSQVSSYFELAPSLDSSVELTGENAMEVGGSAKLFYVPEHNWLAIGDGEQPTITRYTLEEGELVKGESLSMLSYGVDSLWDTLYSVSAQKAYYPDRDNGQLIIINPQDMTIDGTIDLGETVREGYLALYSYEAIMRDGKLLFSVGWFDWDNDRVLSETGLVVIDPTTDALTRFDLDDRCGGITRPVELPSGDAYFVSSALTAAAHYVDRPASAPCALRIRKGKNVFDPSYAFDLTELSDGAMIGEPAFGGGNEILLRVLDESALDGEPAESWEVTSQLAWSWLRWDVTSGKTTPIDELPLSTSDVIVFDVDGRSIGSQTEADYSSTTLLDLQEKPIETKLTSLGFISGVAHVH